LGVAGVVVGTEFERDNVGTVGLETLMSGEVISALSEVGKTGADNFLYSKPEIPPIINKRRARKK
jgi:hypothetical protein